VADLNLTSPDYILLTARIDYDQKIYHWIESNYRVAGQFGRFWHEESGSTPAALVADQFGHFRHDRAAAAWLRCYTSDAILRKATRRPLECLYRAGFAKRTFSGNDELRRTTPLSSECH